MAPAARDLDVHENVLRKWLPAQAADPQEASPGKGVMKPGQAEIERLRKEVVKLSSRRLRQTSSSGWTPAYVNR